MSLPIIPRFAEVPGLARYLEDLSRSIEKGQRPQIGSQPYDANLQSLSSPFALTNAGLALLDDASASAQLTTLGVSAFIKTLLDDADASTALSTLGISTFIKTLLDDVDAATALATLGISVGSWTPTIANTTNIAASTSAVCYYYRIISQVSCWGVISIDPTLAAPTASQFGISLPVASNIGAIGDLAGLATGFANDQIGRVIGDATNDRAQVDFLANNVANISWAFNFSYRVLP